MKRDVSYGNFLEKQDLIHLEPIDLQCFPIFYNKVTGTLRISELEYNTASASYIVKELTRENEVEILPIKDDGTEGRWYLGLENTREIINELKVVRQDNGLYYVYRRRRPNEGVQPLTTWDDSIYSATEHGTDLLKRMGILILTYHH